MSGRPQGMVSEALRNEPNCHTLRLSGWTATLRRRFPETGMQRARGAYVYGCEETGLVTGSVGNLQRNDGKLPGVHGAEGVAELPATACRRSGRAAGRPRGVDPIRKAADHHVTQHSGLAERAASVLAGAVRLMHQAACSRTMATAGLIDAASILPSDRRSISSATCGAHWSLRSISLMWLLLESPRRLANSS
jgi:hypothetical protein